MKYIKNNLNKYKHFSLFIKIYNIQKEKKFNQKISFKTKLISG